MFGRLLCWIGWHDWRYVEVMDGVRVGSRPEAQHMEVIGYTIRCGRCGVRP